jgi:SAM-dependent methyltransferase
VEERLQELITFVRSQPNYNVQEVLCICHITYNAPADAISLPCADQSIDFHTSYTVFEHIPPSVLRNILLEGNRVIRTGGAFVHRIDYSDHFSHSDKSISPANFLKFSTTEWDKIAGNRYMYMNRLRHDDFLELFKAVNHHILLDEPNLDRELLQMIKQGKPDLHDDFRGKSSEAIATTGAWIVSSLRP